jgi:hypothetical protein
MRYWSTPTANMTAAKKIVAVAIIICGITSRRIDNLTSLFRAILVGTRRSSTSDVMSAHNAVLERATSHRF